MIASTPLLGFRGPMEDRLALRELVDRYSDAVTRCDGNAWAALWTADASWVLAGRKIEGRDAILAAWRDAMARYAFVSFSGILVAVAVDMDVARGCVQTQECLAPTNGPARWQFGHYTDDLVRADGGWLFSRRVFTRTHAFTDAEKGHP